MRGTLVHRRPFPSLVEIAITPLSATIKFAPEIPISAEKKDCRSLRRARATSPVGSFHGLRWPNVPRNKSAHDASPHLFFELEQIFVEMINRFLLDLPAFLAGRVPVPESKTAAQMGGVVAFDALADDVAVNQIRRFHRGFSQKLLGRGLAHGFSWARMPARWIVLAALPRFLSTPSRWRRQLES